MTSYFLSCTSVASEKGSTTLIGANSFLLELAKIQKVAYFTKLPPVNVEFKFGLE